MTINAEREEGTAWKHKQHPLPFLTRRVIASYTRYEEAQRAVDYLSDDKFPVERVAIIGEGLQLVEQVTGRLTWGKASEMPVKIAHLFLGMQ